MMHRMQRIATIFSMFLASAFASACFAGSGGFDAHVYEAERMMWQGDFAEAAELVQRIMTNEPDNAAAASLHKRMLEHRFARPHVALVRLYSLDVKDEPFKLVLEKLTKEFDTSVAVDWQGIQMMGGDPEELVTIDVDDVPGGVLLDLLIHQARFDQLDVRYAVRNGILHIATREVLNQTTISRAYNVRDIVHLDDGQREAQLEAVRGNNDVRLHLRIEEFATLIYDQVGEPEDWEFYGGTVATMNMLDGVMVIRATPEAHAQVRTLLRELRTTTMQTIAFRSELLIIDDKLQRALRLPEDQAWSIRFNSPVTVIDAERRDELDEIVRGAEGRTFTLPALSVPNDAGGTMQIGLREVMLPTDGGDREMTWLVSGLAVSLHPFIDDPSNDKIRLGVETRVIIPVEAMHGIGGSSAVGPGVIEVEKKEQREPVRPRVFAAESSSEAIVPSGDTLIVSLGKVSAKKWMGIAFAEDEEHHAVLLITPTITGNAAALGLGGE